MYARAITLETPRDRELIGPIRQLDKTAEALGLAARRIAVPPFPSTIRRSLSEPVGFAIAETPRFIGSVNTRARYV